MERLTNKELCQHDIYSQFVPEKAQKRLFSGKGFTKNQQKMIEQNLNQQFVAEWDGKAKRWLISGERDEFIKKADRRGKSASNTLAYNQQVDQLLVNFILSVAGNERNYTALDCLSGKGSQAFSDYTSKEIEQKILDVIHEYRDYFNAFRAFRYGSREININYFEKVFESNCQHLVNEVKKELTRRSNDCLRRVFHKFKINYKKTFLANVENIRFDDDRQHLKFQKYNLKTIIVSEKTFNEYKKFRQNLKSNKVNDFEISKLTREKFKFNYAFEVYEFLNNSHLEKFNEDSQKSQVRDLLFDVLIKNAVKSNAKLGSYNELFESTQFTSEELFVLMLKDKGYFKLKRHREYLKFCKLVYFELLTPAVSKKISREELNRFSEGSPEGFSIILLGNILVIDSEMQRELDIKPAFSGAVMRMTEEHLNQLKMKKQEVN